MEYDYDGTRGKVPNGAFTHRQHKGAYATELGDCSNISGIEAPYTWRGDMRNGG